MSFSTIKFNAKAHTYTLNDKKLTAVNTYISKFKKPFNRDEVAARVAQKQGRTIESVLEEWQEKSTKGLVRGTKVHSHIQKILKNKLTIYDMESKINEASVPQIAQFNQFWDKFGKDFHVYMVEKAIGDYDLGVGGTVDTVFLTLKENTYNIWDWKTNSEFKLDNPWENLLTPFDDLPASDLNYYSLQTSLYQLILETGLPQLKFGDNTEYIEQVTYSEPYNLQITGGDDQRLKIYLAQKGLSL